MSLEQQLAAALDQRRALGRMRTRLQLQGEQGVELQLEGKALVNFSSNDYLGLAAHPDLSKALADSASHWGLGAGASHLVCGHSEQHHLLEEELADFVGRERALLFSTGYMANMGAIQALLGREDAIFEDKLNHASLLDGALLCRAKRQRYGHADYSNLQDRLQASSAKRKLVVTDSVFSMDGDCADLTQLSQIAAQHDAYLMVDDAHGFGVLGDGRGAAAHFSLTQSQLPIYMATLGKALGSFGAFIAGSDTVIEYLSQFARPYIYTTAMPPALAAASRVALHLLKTQGWRRLQLIDNIRYFKQRCAEHGLQLMPSDTAIQPMLIGDDKKLMRLAAKLKAAGFIVGAIRPPTVAEGTARLRLTISAAHQAEHIDALIRALVAALAEINRS